MTSALWLRIVVVAVAGAIGALARWGTSVGAHALLGRAWPVGTLVVNVVGCFVFGLAFESMRDEEAAHAMRRLIWLTGFCGAFTTFSTFAFDLVELNSQRGAAFALLNIGLHVGLGLAAVVAGQVVWRLQ
jgi:CrcB protein